MTKSSTNVAGPLLASNLHYRSVYSLKLLEDPIPSDLAERLYALPAIPHSRTGYRSAIDVQGHA